jgi:hypothetical protein
MLSNGWASRRELSASQSQALLSIGLLLACDRLALASQLLMQLLLNIGWMLACDWLALYSLWVVPTNTSVEINCVKRYTGKLFHYAVL